MIKLRILALTLLLTLCLFGSASAQTGAIADKKAESIHVDALIDTFFSKRTGDLPEMLKVRQIRVLVVPSRTSYFIDDQGQLRGLDYEIFKAWEKILNKNRRKGEAPVSVIFIPETIEEFSDALL